MKTIWEMGEEPVDETCVAPCAQPGRVGRVPRAPSATKLDLQRTREIFDQAGITIAGWAKANGFAYMTVIDVLNGRRAGHHGEAHRVALALGLKKGRVVDVALFNPATAVAAATAARNTAPVALGA